jgi:hypothetical protein
MISKYTTQAQKLTYLQRFSTRAFSATPSDKPKHVLVTGAAGQIAYSIVFRIAS